MKTKNAVRFVISVLVRDRVGILRDIATTLTPLGANIDALSQTVVEGFFTVILAATFSKAWKPEELRARILEKFPADESSVAVWPYTESRAGKLASAGGAYILTCNGKDRKGVLLKIFSFLAEKGINVTDWTMLFSRDQATYIGEIVLPDRLDLQQIQEEFRQILQPLRMTGGIQHENIFRATNEVGAIKALLTETRHD